MVFLVKLYIELTMAELIAKLARSEHTINTYHDTMRSATDGPQLTSSPVYQPRRIQGIISEISSMETGFMIPPPGASGHENGSNQNAIVQHRPNRPALLDVVEQGEPSLRCGRRRYSVC